MGLAADDMFDVAMHEQEMRSCLRDVCRKRNKDPKMADKCDWFINDEGIYECKHCWETTDL